MPEEDGDYHNKQLPHPLPTPLIDIALYAD
jgi:hypothetical protein